jgi:hypothetical protein
MRVYAAGTHAHVQRLVSVVKIATVLEYTTEEQRSGVLVLWTEGLGAMDIHEEMFHVHGERYLSRKAVHNWVSNVFL